MTSLLLALGTLGTSQVAAQPSKRPKDADGTYDERLKATASMLYGEWKLTIFDGKKDTKNTKASGLVTLAEGGTFSLQWDDPTFQPDKEKRKAGERGLNGTWSADVLPKDEPKEDLAFRFVMFLPDGKSLFFAPRSIMNAGRNSFGSAMGVHKENCVPIRWQFVNWADFQRGATYGEKLWRFERTAATTVGSTAPPARTVELRVGMFEEDVVSAAGQSLKRAILSDRVIWQYSDMTVTLVNGKVADIQLK